MKNSKTSSVERRQCSNLLSNLRQQPDARAALRRECARLQKQTQRLRAHRLWLQLQDNLDRTLRATGILP